ncbi:MAG: substrate-binding domain-containing protein, partial [Clostridia bacterium]|nr:substrate-binding domain-containing protein [Clostridia bacterium]
TGACIRHYIALGHKRIALLGGDGFVLNENSREQGYLDGMNQYGLGEYIYPFTVGQNAHEGEAALVKLMSMKIERPTALICYNDLIALGAMKMLREMGMSVPGDIAVLGCDNLFFGPYLEPGLTSVDLRAEEIANYAMNLLTQAQEKPLEAFGRMFESQLIIRRSCGFGL